MTNKFYKAKISFPNFVEGNIYENTISVSDTVDRYPHLFIDMASLNNYKIICAYIGDNQTLLNDVTACSYVDFINSKQDVIPISILDIKTDIVYSVGDIIEYGYTNTKSYSKIKSFIFEEKLLFVLENGSNGAVITTNEIFSHNDIIGEYYDSKSPIKINDSAFIYDKNKTKLYETTIDKKRYNIDNFIYFSDKLFAVRYTLFTTKVFSLNDICENKHLEPNIIKNVFIEIFGDKFNVEDDELRCLFN